MKVFAKVFLLSLFLFIPFSTQVFAVNAADILNFFEKGSSSKQEEKESSQWQKKTTATSRSERTIFTSESYANFYFQLQIPIDDGPANTPFHFALFYVDPSSGSENAIWSILDCVDARTLSALFKLSFEELIKFLEDKIASMGSSRAKSLLQAFVSMIKEYMEYLAQQTEVNAATLDENDLFGGDDPFSEEEDIFAPTEVQGVGNQNQTETFPALDPQVGLLMGPLLLSIASLSGSTGSAAK